MSIDGAHFAHMTGGDKALQREVLSLFRMQVEAWRKTLTPGENWRDATHTLKGSARGIGLNDLAAVCESAEKASDAEAADATARVRAALDEALNAVSAYEAEIAA